MSMVVLKVGQVIVVMLVVGVQAAADGGGILMISSLCVRVWERDLEALLNFQRQFFQEL
jgi:hypothetical protein